MELVKIIKYLEKKFPLKLASEWDKVGLQNLNPKQMMTSDQEIKKVLICLDLTNQVLDQAIDESVDLILTRHPFIFAELNLEKRNPCKKLMIEKLIKNQILVYSLHTNYDASPNQKLPFLLEENFKVRSYNRIGVDREGYQVKLKTKIKLQDLKKTMQTLFLNQKSLQSLSWNDQQTVAEFYLTTGSGSQSMIDEKLQNCVFVTGEMKWNSWIYANDNQVAVLAVGHYMENYFTKHLKEMLINAFPELLVLTFDIQNQYN